MRVPSLRAFRFSMPAILLLMLPLSARGAESVDVQVSSKSKPFGGGDRCIGLLAVAPTIDGTLSECKGRKPTIVLAKANMKPFGRVDAQVDDDADASATVWIAHTPQGFYVGARVTDDTLVGGAKGKDWARMSPFTNDMLMVSFLSGLKASAAHQEAPLMLSYYEPGASPRPQKHPAQYIVVRQPDGYVAEALLPYGSLGWRPQAGDWLTFYVILVDQDGLTPEGKRNWGQLLYTGKPQPRLRLIGPATHWGGDVHTDQPRLPADQPLYLSGTIDALLPGVINKVTVLDGEENAVCESALRVTLPARHTTRFGIDFGERRLDPGRYQAVVTFGAQGASAGVARTAFAVMTPQPDVPPKAKLTASVPHGRFALPKDPPPYKPMTVTKADYWKLVRELWPHKHFKVPFDQPDKVTARNYGIHTSSYMIDFVLAYKLTQNAAYARVAIEHLKTLDETTRSSRIAAEQYDFQALAEMLHLMKDSPDLPPAERKRWRELVVREARHTWANEKHQGGMFEYGNNNRGFWYLFRYGYALKLAPDVPEAKIWKPYVDRMWPYYAKIKDVDENTSGYGIGDPFSVVHYLRVMGLHDAYFRDPEARAFHGRWAHELSPFGDLPPYGDGASLCWGLALLPQFEHMASVTRDGRYKWAAHRVVEFVRRRKLDTLEYVDAQNFLTRTLWALYFCDDSIREVTPTWGSELLTRKKYVSGDWGKRFYWYMDQNVSMPHAMVLRSGWHPDDLFATVECAPGGGHAPAMPGSIYYLAKDRTPMTFANPYRPRAQQNVVHLSDLEGLADKVAEQIRVPLFVDKTDATVGRLEVTGYQELPAKTDRIICFVKNRFLLVKDRIRFQDAGLFDVACRWHTQNVGLQTGVNWANTFFNRLENWSHIPAACKTYDRDLLVWFTPQPRHRLTVTNLQAMKVDMFAPVAVGQRWSGRVRAGKLLHFTTVLMPHRPKRKLDKLVGGIKVQEDSADRTILRIVCPVRDASGRERTYPFLLAHNEPGSPLSVKFEGIAIQTDARYLIVGLYPAAPGRRLTAVDATFVTLDAKPVHKSERRTAFEKRW